MRLVDLNPRWFSEEGRHGQGVLFDCPHCVAGGTIPRSNGTGNCSPVRLAVAFSPALDGGAPIALRGEPDGFERLMKAICENGVDWPTDKVPPGVIWARTGDTFDNLSLSPSVDASRSGHWHGFVSNGEVR